MVGYSDTAGNDNYLWKVNPDAASREDRYKVNVVDWAGAKETDPEGTTYAGAPTLYEVPSNIFAPTESPKTSDKSSSDGNSGGEKTPPRTGHSGERKGLRSQGEASTSGTQ
jgi:hypothetical protein